MPAAPQPNPVIIDASQAQFTANYLATASQMPSGTLLFVRDPVPANGTFGVLYMLDITPAGVRSWQPITTYVPDSPQTARFIVGNALAGDTAEICDYLDPGDGTGITAALADASGAGRGDIFVRSGTYTIPGSNFATPTFTVPSNVTLRGAGNETKIVGSPAQRHLFELSGDSSLHDLSIEMPPNAGAPLTDAVVRFASETSNISVRNVDLTFVDPVADAVFAAFGGSDNSNCFILDCNVYGGRLRAPNVFASLASAYRFDSLSNSTIRGTGNLDALLYLESAEDVTANLRGNCFKASAILACSRCNIALNCNTNFGAQDADPIMIVAGTDRTSLDLTITNATDVIATMLFLDRCTDLAIQANLVKGLVGIFNDSVRTVITASSITTNSSISGTFGISIASNASETTIEGTTILQSETGIIVDQSSTRITGSRISLALAGIVGINVLATATNTVIDSTSIEARAGIGIDISGSINQITGCTVYGDDTAIRLNPGVVRSSITGNYLDGGPFGINVLATGILPARTMITGCTILAAGTGINIVAGSLNNLVIGNAVTAAVPFANAEASTLPAAPALLNQFV